MIAAIVVLAVLAAVGVVAVQRSRRAFKRLAEPTPDVTPASDPAARHAAVRLTSGALNTLGSPPWRVVYEVTPDRLTGIEHVLIGPPGAFALTTTIDALPTPPPADAAADPVAVARAAMTRGGLDDALARVRLSSAGLVTVHWGGAGADAPAAVAGQHGVTHVDGRRLGEWVAGLDGAAWSAAQVDLAWQAVVTAIGRPDPLA
jgi:hypothetical protein